MDTEETPLQKLLNELSLNLIMVDPEDLIALGEVLEKLERLETTCFEQGTPTGSGIAKGLVKTVEAVVLDQVKDKDRAMELVGEGIGLLQEMARNLAAGASDQIDLAQFADALKSNAGVDITNLAVSGQPAETQTDTPTPSPEPPAEEKPAPAENAVRAEAKPADEEYDVEQDTDLFFGFINESLEHIESIEVNIISLEQDPTDKDTINAVFRPFHTIKGVSGFLNLRHIHKLTHDVENLLDDARNERIPVSAAMIDLVLDAVDILKNMIFDVKSAMETGRRPSEEFDTVRINDRILAVRQGDSAEEPIMEGSPYAGKKLGEILIDQGMIDEEELERIVYAQESSRLYKLGDLVVEKGIISQDDLEDALRLQMEDQEKKIGEILIETGKAAPSEISKAIREQESIREQRIGEMLIRESKTGAREVAAALREQKKAPESGKVMGQTVKVDTAKLDGLVDLMGELVIAQSLVSSNERILNLKDQKVLRDLSHMSRITSELQRMAMSMRMVQIRQTFQKMIRLVRDLSRKSGKMVELEMSGEDTEIDRTMVEAIYDPLVHMVRNSVDHGIEPREERTRNGKPEEGSVHLRAFHQGGNVVIEIIDDGKGLNKERILEKAIQRGLISPDDNLSDSAIFNLIFQPGFSTAEKITDVSGRGVGMDVVKRAIEKLRGKIEINSKPGQGSTITIRLPLTLAIIDGMIVRLGQNRYILPTVSIHESFRPGENDYHTVKGQGEMIKVRENLLPLIRLDQVVDASGSASDPMEALVVVVENEGERRCIMVDEVLGKQEVVIKSLGERLKHIRALAGGSILGDGTVGLILDIAGIFELSDGMMGGGIIRPSVAMDSDWEMDDDWGMGPA